MATGRFRLLHRGVYAVGQAELTREGTYLAAVLALGRGAVLSHTSAANLWGFLSFIDKDPPHVTVPRRTRPRQAIRVHGARLERDDTTRRRGIPVTTPTRTLLDLATLLPPRQLRRATNQALVDRLTSLPHLHWQLEHATGRPGSTALGAIVQTATPTRSFLEDILLPLIKEAGLPTPETNVKVEGLEVDLLFRDQRVIVEADGAQFHDNPLARADDAAKQAALEAAGYTVLRVSYDQATRHPAQTIERLRSALYRSAR